MIAASSSSAGGYCSGGWTDNASVDCDSNGNPTGVSTEYGNFGNCQQAIGNTDCSIAPESYYSVDYCCQPSMNGGMKARKVKRNVMNERQCKVLLRQGSEEI